MFDPNLVQNNFFYQYGGSTCQLLRQPAGSLSPQYEHTLLDYQCLYPILNQRASRQHRVLSQGEGAQSAIPDYLAFLRVGSRICQ